MTNLSSDRLDEITQSFPSTKVMIIGDIMLDEYMWGDVNRISPEAPVPVVKVEEIEERPGGAANVALNIKSLGGTPQKLPFKEVYTALGQGVVDGQENAWSNVYSKKFYEVQDYISVSNHSYLGYLLVVSSEFWSQLPEDIRSELSAIIEESTTRAREFAAEADREDRKKVESAGKAKVVELSQSERDQWRTATAGVEQRFRKQIGADLLNKVHALLGH